MTDNSTARTTDSSYINFPSRFEQCLEFRGAVFAYPSLSDAEDTAAYSKTGRRKSLVDHSIHKPSRKAVGLRLQVAVMMFLSFFRDRMLFSVQVFHTVHAAAHEDSFDVIALCSRRMKLNSRWRWAVWGSMYHMTSTLKLNNFSIFQTSCVKNGQGGSKSQKLRKSYVHGP